MPDKTWKATERRVAHILGGKRAGPTGRRGPDVLHPTLAPEVKHRKSLPQWLKDAVAQAVRNAPNGKLPLVVLHEQFKPVEKSFVVVPFDYWRDWYGDLNMEDTDGG